MTSQCLTIIDGMIHNFHQSLYPIIDDEKEKISQCIIQ